MPVVVRSAPKPTDWQLVIYSLSEDGTVESFTYERTIDGVTEECTKYRDAQTAPDHVRARRSRDEMICDSLFSSIAHAYN